MKKQSSKGTTLKGSPFKDNIYDMSSGKSDTNFEGFKPSKLDGDAHLNGQKLIIGYGLKDFVDSPDGDA
jgi:hypothetical protein